MKLERLRHVADIRISNVDKKAVEGDIPVRLCNYTDVYYNERIKADLDFMDATATPDQLVAFHLAPGDVVLTKDSETPDDIGVAAVVLSSAPDVVCGYHLALVRPKASRLDGRYLRYALASGPARGQMSSFANGITRFGLRASSIGNVVIPMRAIDEQRAIADYLDRETSRLDALLDMKLRLVDLVFDRWGRHLDREIWDIPAQRIALRRLCQFIRDGTHQPPQRVAEGFPLLSVRNIVDGEFIRLEDDSMINEGDFLELSRALSPKEDDLVLAIVGATLGKVAVVGKGIGPFVLQRSVAVLRMKNELASAQFIRYALESARLQSTLRSMVAFSAQPGIYLGALAALKIPAPDLTIQLEIVDNLSATRARINASRRRLIRQIELLRERRAALITAAVNGRISISSAA